MVFLLWLLIYLKTVLEEWKLKRHIGLVSIKMGENGWKGYRNAKEGGSKVFVICVFKNDGFNIMV